MKGAWDGGLNVSHSNKILPGFYLEEKSPKYDAKVWRERIFGNHISAYMEKLKGENENKYNQHFA